MYLSYYNLESKPFQMSTDPDFLWLGEKHKEALATLKYAIVENKGVLALTGDVGTGKTTLINALIQSLGDDTLAATIYDPSLGVLEFFNIVSTVFNLGRTFDSKGEFLIHFKRFLKEVRAQNKKVLLIIDEAQRINNELLEEVRLLSNLEDEYVRLLNIFFVGQNEFVDILKEYKNRALRQRITLRYHLEPLTLSETEAYTRHRLKIAGAKAHIFSSGAIEEIFSFSTGYPRLINIICDHALLSGYVRELLIITEDIIKECRDELQISSLNMGQDTHSPDEKEAPKPEFPFIQRETGPGHKRNRSWSMATGMGFLALMGLVAGYAFYNPVKARRPSVSSRAFMQGKTTDFGQSPKKNELGATVLPVPENKGHQDSDSVEAGKAEDSRYYMVRGPEPKLFKEIDVKKEEIFSTDRSGPATDPADVAATSIAPEEPKAIEEAAGIEAAAKLSSEKPNAAPPKAIPQRITPVLMEKTIVHKDRAKPDIIEEKDLYLPKSRPGDYAAKTVAPAPSEKPAPRVRSESFTSVQKPAAAVEKSFPTLREPAAAVVPKKDKPPVETRRVPTAAGLSVPATASEPEKVAGNIEPKTVAQSRKEIEPQASTVYDFASEDLQPRLKLFLKGYCRTYENEQLDRFAGFFTSDALEKGRSFRSRLDQYRQTFQSVDSMDYRIELKRYAVQEGTSAIRIQGNFYARARLVENNKWVESSGPISMELVAYGNSFKVRRLDY
jgi:type II secretory pathway predicted ATPase ExeA